MFKREDCSLTDKDLWDIITNLHDEIMVYDDDYNMVFVNEAAVRHYGKKPEELLGSKFSDLDDTYWGNSTLPEVYEKKVMVAKRQITNLGQDIITISVPLLDDAGNIRYVIQNVNDIYTYTNLGVAEQPLVDVSVPSSERAEFIVASKELQTVMETVKVVSRMDNPCLILGETGTGKTKLAKVMSKFGTRRDMPFVIFNCSSVNPDTADAVLFGTADEKDGLVATAEGGTLFLDEISELPHLAQSKIADLIEKGEYLPIGSSEPMKADVRIVAATNRNLKEMVDADAFRKDLYYRLIVFEILIPPLRERPDDIRALSRHYVEKFEGKGNYLTDEAMDILMKYDWPGNVRELKHTIQKAVCMCKSEAIGANDLPKQMFNIAEKKVHAGSLDEAIESLKREMVTEAFDESKTSTGVAKKLGISQPTASRLISKYCK